MRMKFMDRSRYGEVIAELYDTPGREGRSLYGDAKLIGMHSSTACPHLKRRWNALVVPRHLQLVCDLLQDVTAGEHVQLCDAIHPEFDVQIPAAVHSPKMIDALIAAMEHEENG